MDMKEFSKLLGIRPYINGAVFNKDCIDFGNELYINAISISSNCHILMNDLLWNNFALLTRSKMLKFKKEQKRKYISKYCTPNFSMMDFMDKIEKELK